VAAILPWVVGGAARSDHILQAGALARLGLLQAAGAVPRVGLGLRRGWQRYCVSVVARTSDCECTGFTLDSLNSHSACAKLSHLQRHERGGVGLATREPRAEPAAGLRKRCFRCPGRKPFPAVKRPTEAYRGDLLLKTMYSCILRRTVRALERPVVGPDSG
jgi:hypothetical protein